MCILKAGFGLADIKPGHIHSSGFTPLDFISSSVPIRTRVCVVFGELSRV